MRDDLPWFGFGGEDAGCGLFIDFFLGSLGEAAGKLLITDGTGGAKMVKSAWTCRGGSASMIS